MAGFQVISHGRFWVFTEDPEYETFVIHMRLKGTYEARVFLSDQGIDEKRIAFAIEELGRSRQVKVWNLQRY
jgi:hypothetical protein